MIFGKFSINNNIIYFFWVFNVNQRFSNHPEQKLKRGSQSHEKLLFHKKRFRRSESWNACCNIWRYQTDLQGIEFSLFRLYGGSMNDFIKRFSMALSRLEAVSERFRGKESVDLAVKSFLEQ